MADDRSVVGAAVEGWLAAIRAGDLEGVLADHTEDLVMFDVPPPEDGIRGLAAYRATWPPFFDWLRSGAVFEVTELHVTAGEDVAFAWALLRCGSAEELRSAPERRLRLTVGLRKAGDRWLIAHEHHSFTHVA